MAVERRSERLGARIGAAEASLRALDPNQVLERGYAFLSDRDGRAITQAAQVRPGQSITATLADGSVDLTVDR